MGLMLIATGNPVRSDAAVADAAPAAAAEAPSSAAAPDQEFKLDEVVVTAQKKRELLLDVPVPVTAISANNLLETNKSRFQDYFSEVPGLSYSTDGSDFSDIAIRGLSTGPGNNPTVAIMLDDVPLSASTLSSGGSLIPEINPADLANVEILRGPQGTLYGAASLGGLVKYTTVDPSTSAVKGQITAGTSHLQNAGGVGYNVNAALNVPLSSTFALRVSGFAHEDPGYLDNPATGVEGTNKWHTAGAHIASLWTPSDTFSVKLSALYQSSIRNGADQIELISPITGTPLADLQQENMQGTGYHHSIIAAYSATVRAKLGAAELTSVTGYSRKQILGQDDVSVLYQQVLVPLTPLQFPTAPADATGILNGVALHSSKFSQELRVSLPITSSIDWLAGLFYTREWAASDIPLSAAEIPSGNSVGQWLNIATNAPYKESAVFTDLTVHFTPEFDVQLGGRASHIQEYDDEIDSGPYETTFVNPAGPDVLVYPHATNSANAVTYLLTPRYKFSPDLMAYARFASGYRPGAINAGSQSYGFPEAYSPDKTNDYEVGVKGTAFDHALTFDASVYYIDWKDIQLALLTSNGYAYNGNGGRAKSQGLELSVQSRPARGLTLGGWISVNDAKLTEAFPTSASAVGVSGDRLPLSNRFSGNLTADQEFPLTDKMTGSIGATLTYVSSRLGSFNSLDPITLVAPPRQNYPAYATTDVRAAVHYEQWTVTLYGSNVMDRRALLYGGVGSGTNPLSFSINEPRRVGLNVTMAF
jgi:iron complex outermembrane recepter protein